jgi:hypothetical protein
MSAIDKAEIKPMSYEAWRISFQDPEQAARAAFVRWCAAEAWLLMEKEALERQLADERTRGQGLYEVLKALEAEITTLRSSLEGVTGERDGHLLEVVRLRGFLKIYRDALDSIYNHNEAARAAVVMHFGTTHPVIELPSPPVQGAEG